MIGPARALASAAALAAVAATGVAVTQQGATAAGDSTAQESTLWRLSVDGAAVATSTSCSGFGSRTDVVEYKSAGADGSEEVQKIPGTLRATDITCAFALEAPRALYDWRRQVENGDIAAARKSALFDLIDDQGAVVQSWTVSNAWPAQYLAGPDRTVVVLTHEGAVRQP